MKVMEAVRGYFSPELLNRIDEICVFNRLTRKDMDAIVVKELKPTQAILKSDHDVRLELSESLRNWIADKGFDPRYGARPLRRAIQHEILNPLSLKMIEGSIIDGDHVVIDLSKKGDGIDFKVEHKKPD